MFKNAIVLSPAFSLKEGLTTSDIGKPDYNLASEQHKIYTETLIRLGLKVKVLPKNELFPDSVFIEDIALCTQSCATITRPGATTRRGEITSIREVLEDYYTIIEEIIYPGTLEAGDVMMAGDKFFIGISDRTNEAGAEQLTGILAKYGMKAIKVPLKKLLHLKSGISYLENNTILVCGELTNRSEFADYIKIVVDEDECYAANSLWVNGKVLIPHGFPKTRKKIESAGYETILIDVSEFRKVDGGLSCLSLRF